MRLPLHSVHAAALLALVTAASAETTGLVPLNTLGVEKYQGFTGGLYADGKNEPHGAHAEALRKMCAVIQPLDAEGRPAAGGKIVVVGLGASVSRQLFDALVELGPRAEGKRAAVVFVNGARGGHDVHKISDPALGYWEYVRAAVAKAGCAPAQVQVAWYQSDDLRDSRDDFPGRPQRLQAAIAQNLRELRAHFPHTQLCYHSARHTTAFAPEAGAKAKHGEPRPWHVGWAVKWLLEAQTAARDSQAPLVAWAGYFWTDADQPRSDGYRWTREMNVADGIHLSDAGKARVAQELLDFWRTDAFAKTWFTAARETTAAKLKPQILAAQKLQPGEPALLINGKSKFAKLERLLATTEAVTLAIFEPGGKELRKIEDVFHQRIDLNELLGPGSFRLHFLGKDGARLKMTMDVPDLVTLK